MTSTKRHAVLTVKRASSSNTCESGLGFVIDDFFEAIGTAKKGLQCNALANLPPRVDCDVIAPLCDSQPYRTRTVDPEFLAFIEQHASSEALSLLDIKAVNP